MSGNSLSQSVWDDNICELRVNFEMAPWCGIILQNEWYSNVRYHVYDLATLLHQDASLVFQKKYIPSGFFYRLSDFYHHSKEMVKALEFIDKAWVRYQSCQDELKTLKELSDIPLLSLFRKETK